MQNELISKIKNETIDHADVRSLCGNVSDLPAHKIVPKSIDLDESLFSGKEILGIGHNIYNNKWRKKNDTQRRFD